MNGAGGDEWDDLFQNDLIPVVLDHVVATWNRLPDPKPRDLEKDITLNLYCALKKDKDRSRHPFLIRYEDVEVDTELVKETGRKDIVFFPTAFDEDIYFCLEAKRLNVIVNGVRKSLADEYVKEGMQRFVDGKYARHVHHGGMLGYVLDGDVLRAMKNVRRNIRANHKALRMNPPRDWTPSSARPNDPHAKETEHSRQHDPAKFCIHHQFVGPSPHSSEGESD